MTAPTPGTWIAEHQFTLGDDPSMIITTERDGRRIFIASVDYSADPAHTPFIHDVEEMRANAYVLAAAKDLLDVGKRLLAILNPEIGGSPGSALEDLRAAIAKATRSA